MAEHFKKHDLVDWKKNNKVEMRNFKETSDFHDVVKLLLVRMLRRRYPNSAKYPIYTEASDEEGIPDIKMHLGKDIYVWEIQDKISKEWTERMNDKYQTVDWFCVPLKKLNREWKGGLKRLINLLEHYLV